MVVWRLLTDRMFLQEVALGRGNPLYRFLLISGNIFSWFEQCVERMLSELNKTLKLFPE